MATATAAHVYITLQCSQREPFFLGHRRSIPIYVRLTRQPASRLGPLTFARRRRKSTDSPVTSKKQNKKNATLENIEEDDSIDEDAFEALFRQLEEDLKNGDLSFDDNDDDEISEEDLAKLENELAEALNDDELFGVLDSSAEIEDESQEETADVDGDYDDDSEGEDDYEETPVKLKSWQLRRLAYALKNGRRKTSIKNLAADLCLDRAVVLKLLRDPTPNLVLMSAALPDEPDPTIVEPANRPIENDSLETSADTARAELEEKLPVHVMQSNWSARKRLKKVQLETLEQVYRRTKRPTNAMISSIVHLTNLPRKRVVKWFEDKRAEDGVPETRLPYQRSTPQTVFTS